MQEINDILGKHLYTTLIDALTLTEYISDINMLIVNLY